MRRHACYPVLFALALLGSCYETPLIPVDDDATPTRSGASTGGTAATAGKAGKSATNSGGGSQAGSPFKPEGGGGVDASAGAPGQAGEAPGDGGQGGAQSLTGISWLSLVEDEAPATTEPNHELDIQGYFYAYADDCADVSWNPKTRCLSGRLCDPNVYSDAWGVAVGFDFRNTGTNGTPPDTKLLWNPNAVGARGIAWNITGSAPSLQVWVLNMDASYGGQCSMMTCEIPGPPDGVDVANAKGQLLFDEMVKDWWGGAGTPYDFDPAAVHALQIKLPAIRAHDATFDFCVRDLGIIR